MGDGDDWATQGSLGKMAAARLRGLFHLWDQTDRDGAVVTITEGIEFKGASVWSLMIAVLLASIGLNTNSTALIIGAMLVSPLMGPIMGAGLALGTYDAPLLRRALLNLGVMTGISLAVSFVYFSVSPLRGATPELLARTVPTFFDVLVALFGGTAMIIAVSRKSRSTNTIAGVAVATALMPPLCAAGYGLANREMGIFAGAAYLYLINSVFIGLTTLFFTKYLRLRPADGVGRQAITRGRVAVFALVAVAFLAPSVYMAYDVIQETGFQSSVDRFIAMNMNFPDSQISGVVKKRGSPRSTLQVTIVGAPLSGEMVRYLNAQLPSFGLEGTDLKIIQNAAAGAVAVPAPAAVLPASAPVPPALPAGSVPAGTDPAPPAATEPAVPSASAAALSASIGAAGLTKELERVSKEVDVLFPGIESFSWGDLLEAGSGRIDPVRRYTVLVKWKDVASSQADQARLSVFLHVRLGADNLAVVNM